jgi:FtsP/CotA-like multicopper oxidase with cupredoxin domain
MFTGQHQMSMPKSGAAATQASTLAAASSEKPIVLAPYVDPLPVSPIIRPAKSASPLPIRMRAFRQRAHRDLPPTSLWGYNNSWPGPTIEVRRGQPLSVKWSNELPLKHFLPIDPTIHGAEEGVPEVRTIVHVHGAQVMPEATAILTRGTHPTENSALFPAPIPRTIPTISPRPRSGITTTRSVSRASTCTLASPAFISSAMMKRTR